MIKFLHITLICSLLTSSVGVVVNQHFCRDELKSISFYTAVKSCHGPAAKKKPACPYHQNKEDRDGLDRKNCCSNTSDLFKTSQEQQIKQSDLSFLTAPFAVIPAGGITVDFTSSITQPSGKYYRPPPLTCDYSVIFQSFRL